METLEDRITPTTFTPTVATDGVSTNGQIKTLRDCILAANADTSSGTDTINLAGVNGGNVTYTLTEIETKKTVVSDSASARASYDIPGDEQRFARQRALRDAEDRAVVQISESVRSRLASFFVAGT